MLGDRRHTVSGRIGTQASVASPQSTAGVLNALFKVSRREVENITVFGGWECSFIAALSQWLFKFTTSVEDEDGTLIFTSAPNNELAQVRIHYASDAVPELQLTKTTYILKDSRDLWQHDEPEMSRHLIYRVPWDSCLSRVFSSSVVHSLLALPMCVGEFLGSAARIYGALANAEEDVAEFSRSDYIDFAEASYGRGYTASVEKTFPELACGEGLREIMFKQLQKSVGGAVVCLELAVQNLKRLCACSICNGDMPKFRDGEGKMRLIMDKVIMSSSPGTVCLVGMVLSVQNMVRIVASVQLEAPLQPTASGIEHCYESQATAWLQYTNSTRDSKPHEFLKFIAKALHLTIERRDMKEKEKLYFVRKSQENNLSLLLQEVAQVFIGRNYVDGVNNSRVSAISQSGICIYMESLQSVRCHPNLLRKLHILPGHIERGSRIYSELLDPQGGETPEKVKCPFTVSKQATQARTTLPEKPFLKALVTENSIGGASFCYGVSLVEDAPSIGIIKPVEFAWLMLYGMGRIVCDKNSCKEDLIMPCCFMSGGHVSDSLQLEHQSSIACCIWPQQDITGKYWILKHIVEKVNTHGVFLVQRNECLSCCSEAAFRIGNKFATNNMFGIRDDQAIGIHII